MKYICMYEGTTLQILDGYCQSLFTLHFSTSDFSIRVFSKYSVVAPTIQNLGTSQHNVCLMLHHITYKSIYILGVLVIPDTPKQKKVLPSFKGRSTMSSSRKRNSKTPWMSSRRKYDIHRHFRYAGYY